MVLGQLNIHMQKKEDGDFPGGPVVKNPPSNEGGAGSIPGWGTKIPHAAGQLSLRCNYRAHALWSLCATTTEPVCSGAHVPQLKRSPCTTTREKPVHRNEEPACHN